MATLAKNLKLPEHYEVEPELLEQFSNRPGHQRCVEGRDEFLLVVHAVPQPGLPEPGAVFFWKRRVDRRAPPGRMERRCQLAPPPLPAATG